MKDKSQIDENELDGSLNELFLETYSRTEDARLAHFLLDQDYGVEMSEHRRKKLLRKLKWGRGKSFLFFALIGLIITIVLPIYFHLRDTKKETHFPPTTQPSTVAPELKNNSNDNQKASNLNEQTDHPTQDANKSFFSPPTSEEIKTDTTAMKQLQTEFTNEKELKTAKKSLPYFDIAGLEYFQKVKDNLFLSILKMDYQFYTKIEPGATMYMNRELLVSPLMMSNFPVTNLQYKVFLADLFRQGRIKEMEKYLPKQELWNEYACEKLAKDYFENESYNYFPVVNINKEATLMYCQWMEEEMNKKLGASNSSKSKAAGKNVQVSVRLPFDYEWIYAVDASYAIMPDCKGYNTIYDSSEGLVNAAFLKRNSKMDKRSKRNFNRIDQLNDLNRFGMNENEMIAIYKEAMNFKEKEPATANLLFLQKVENCCLAGHVVELINTRDAGTTLRGCCWKDKNEYLKMADDYQRFNASPFVGFRVIYVSKNGTYKDPFW